MRDSVFDQQTELTSKENNASEIVDVAKDHQVDFPHGVGQRESYRTKSGKVDHDPSYYRVLQGALTSGIVETNAVPVGCL